MAVSRSLGSRRPRTQVAIAALALGALLAGSARGIDPAPVRAHEGQIEIPTYPWWPAVRHPYFRATDGRNIYPYPMLDDLKRTKEPRTWRTVVLENEYLRVTFLPELGGRIYDILDKTTSKPVFYVNHVVKPGLIGQCGAWISGGVEFNTGPAGHTVSAVQPVDVEILPAAKDGSRAVAVGEVERIYRTRWTVVVRLRPGRSFLEEHIRIYNPTDCVRPYYFWNCTAVPNTPGFRFIYPMTLGTDHAGTTFYTWPTSGGKDLSLGKSYQDASSIFAYQCDQDFFGSYDEDADRGVVAFANHHLLVGKKAWTWGQGSYGTMHQMDLTDEDGPYNEVQTGPLPTQADVGRLDPLEAVSWDEYWYPVHGIGSFTYATKDLAVNAQAGEKGLRLRFLGTGSWSAAEARVFRGSSLLASAPAKVSPQIPTDLTISYPSPLDPVEVEIALPASRPAAADAEDEAPGDPPSSRRVLARFGVPLDLPVRKPPPKKAEPAMASELVQSGWQESLFARYPEAEARFRKAMEKDPRDTGARTGLAFLALERDPPAAVRESLAALGVDPDLGPPRFALAAAELRLGNLPAALDDAWKATLDPASAVPARALVGKILIRRSEWEKAASVLSTSGPWSADPTCKNLHGLAHLKMKRKAVALDLARQSLALDPLDGFARSLAWLAGPADEAGSLARLIEGKAEPVLDLAALYTGLGQEDIALQILETFYLKDSSGLNRSIQADDARAGPGALAEASPARYPRKPQANPLPLYWAAYLGSRRGKIDAMLEQLREARGLPIDGVFPHRAETEPVLRWAIETDPPDGKAALLLGHLLFSLGNHEAGRTFWRRAADLGVEVPVACRALGMARLKLDGDRPGAADLLARGHQADPGDPIIAMDLARVLSSIAEKEPEDRRREADARVITVLSPAFERGKGRSDFVALLAGAHSRLGRYAETAKLLDSVRITIWEGAREVHDAFEEAHLALGKAQLDAGRASEALAEFDRALEYPANLATGKMESAREAHIQLLRGRALDALGRRDEALDAYRKAAGEPASKDPKKEEARAKAKEALEKGAGGRRQL